MRKIVTINDMDCYAENGVVYLKLDKIAWGLSFIKMELSGKLVIDTERIKNYLFPLGMPMKSELPEFISEHIFYDLANKATSESSKIFTSNIKNIIIPKVLMK